MLPQLVHLKSALNDVSLPSRRHRPVKFRGAPRLGDSLEESSFTESQIAAVLKEGETGMPVIELCRTHGISNAMFYPWKRKYSGLQVSKMRRWRALEAENARLKRTCSRPGFGKFGDRGCSEPRTLTPSGGREVVEASVQACLSIARAELQAWRGRLLQEQKACIGLLRYGKDNLRIAPVTTPVAESGVSRATESARSHPLPNKLIPEPDKQLCSSLRQPPTLLCFHRRRQLQQFIFDVVERIAHVVKRTAFSKWIGLMGEGPAQLSANMEHAR